MANAALPHVSADPFRPRMKLANSLSEPRSFGAWRGNLFVGALKFRLLVRLELRGDTIVREERMLEGVLGRIRDVRTGPDSYIYLLTDQADGVLARLEPV